MRTMRTTNQPQRQPGGKRGPAYDHYLRSAALPLVDARYRGVTKYNNDVEISACIPIDCIYHHDS